MLLTVPLKSAGLGLVMSFLTQINREKTLKRKTICFIIKKQYWSFLKEIKQKMLDPTSHIQTDFIITHITLNFPLVKYKLVIHLQIQ